MYLLRKIRGFRQRLRDLKGIVMGHDHYSYTLGYFLFGYYIAIGRSARIDCNLNYVKNPFYFIFIKDNPSDFPPENE